MSTDVENLMCVCTWTCETEVKTCRGWGTSQSQVPLNTALRPNFPSNPTCGRSSVESPVEMCPLVISIAMVLYDVHFQKWSLYLSFFFVYIFLWWDI